jgi:glycosyltransferase involved in cell wall biosynthesis
VFNNQNGLLRTLSSLSLDRSAFDICVVDDGSRVPIVLPSPDAGGHRITLVRMPSNRGISAALNVGLRKLLPLAYRYVGRLDSGDTVSPGRFRKQEQYLKENPQAGLVGSFIEFHDVGGGSLFVYKAPESHDELVERLRLENCMIHSGVTIRASVFRSLGLYDERSSVAEDYELFLRIAGQYRLAVIPEVLTRCEDNRRGISVARRRQQQFQRLQLQLRHFDSRHWRSYWGLLRTGVALAAPRPLVLTYKRLAAR